MTSRFAQLLGTRKVHVLMRCPPCGIIFLPSAMYLRSSRANNLLTTVLPVAPWQVDPPQVVTPFTTLRCLSLATIYWLPFYLKSRDG